MDVRPVMTPADRVLAAVEARDADLTSALGQVATWDRQGLRIPRVVVGVDGAPDPGRVEAELGAFGVAGARLGLALAEGSLDAAGMREALAAVRSRTGAVGIVADFGSGARPDLEFLVDYPADALALSPRIVAGIAERTDVAERVRETCTVARELGWRVIAADVADDAEREALAAAGVDEVTGPGIAAFTAPAELGPLLSRLGVTIPAGPARSARAASAQEPAPATAPARATSPAEQRSPFSREAEGGGEVPPARPAQPPADRPAATSISSALPTPAKGSPGRSRPQRGGEAESQRGRRGRRLVVLLFLLVILALVAYAVLAYLGHVPDPLGIEDLEL